jgi:hypothetical protein
LPADGQLSVEFRQANAVRAAARAFFAKFLRRAAETIGLFSTSEIIMGG